MGFRTVGGRLRRRHFTLVEMMVVIAIIIAILGITGGAYVVVQERMAISRTQTLINRVATVLDDLKTKYGFYPPPYAAEDQNCFAWNCDMRNWRNIPDEYIDEYKKKINYGAMLEEYGEDDVVLRDEWGNAIRYQVPGEKNRRTFDLKSAGPNEKFEDQYDVDSDDIIN
ncbi:type II secretion system protein GspG [Victivallis sp. Marseille-Q1083]|uniref:type II secretion system protein GspG n=1 Tax=Victivallis sp. Marseille-Q1083 TaxID=2717288 RepID=UPI001588918D|nr:type II secretion system protein GspG [Victivallis sp. Marseille-Q1083]